MRAAGTSPGPGATAAGAGAGVAVRTAATAWSTPTPAAWTSVGRRVTSTPCPMEAVHRGGRVGPGRGGQDTGTVVECLPQQTHRLGMLTRTVQSACGPRIRVRSARVRRSRLIASAGSPIPDKALPRLLRLVRVSGCSGPSMRVSTSRSRSCSRPAAPKAPAFCSACARVLRVVCGGARVRVVEQQRQVGRGARPQANQRARAGWPRAQPWSTARQEPGATRRDRRARP